MQVDYGEFRRETLEAIAHVKSQGAKGRATGGSARAHA
jgi:hypothetical protein